MKDKDLKKLGIRCIGDEQSPYKYMIPYNGEIDLGYPIDIDTVYALIYDQGERDGIEIGRLMASGLGPMARDLVIRYTDWLSKQNLMISEGVDGHTFRSSMLGGKKYTADELYDMFIIDVMNSNEAKTIKKF